MVPTLLVGDYLFASKYPYGYTHYSLPFSPKVFQGRIFDTPPKRGDVVLFRPPHQTNEDWVKRLVGLPGDRIQVKKSVVYINGKPLKRKKLGTYDWRDQFGHAYHSVVYEESMPSGLKYKVLQDTEDGTSGNDNTPEYIVPAGHYFVMGDNRNHSSDSRVISFLGFVPHENLIGRGELIFFSTEVPTFTDASWWHVWKWPFMTRFSRFLNLIR